MKQKILICHFDLGNGGAEKVLINLLRVLDYSRYDVTLYLLFNHGVNLPFLPSNVKLKYLFNRSPFRGITHLLKLLSPRLLHRFLIKDQYDAEIAFLEGGPTRIISGCPNKVTKLYAWVHIQTEKHFFSPYRSLNEAQKSYSRFDKVVFVSETAKCSFIEKTGWKNLSCVICHNVIDVESIHNQAKESIDLQLDSTKINLCSVGRLTEQKGYLRLVRLLGELKDTISSDWALYILGQGEQKDMINNAVSKYSLQDKIHLLGYELNPYKYVSKMDVFVCSSYKEGYSTAVTESIVVGTPVVTTDCAGMTEIISDSKAGIIVENTDDALREILKGLLNNEVDLDSLRVNALERSKFFSKSNLKEFEDVIS